MKADQGVRGPMSPDGLDEEVWQGLSGVLTAANRGDGNAFLKLLQRFNAGLSDQMRAEAAAVLVYLLRYRVAEILAHRPTDEDLHDLAAQTHPRYAKVVRASASLLEDTLRAAFVMPPTGPQQSGARLFVSAVAAAGTLFENPSADLAVIRPHLAEWRTRSAPKLDSH